MAGEPLLLDETVRRKLDSLGLVARHVRAGVMKGDRRSRKRGVSVEFADYRNYVPGDDLRRLDWNVYARSERSVIKRWKTRKTSPFILSLTPRRPWTFRMTSTARGSISCCSPSGLLPGWLT
ncbi:MAG: DUF58 domain-containing protein [Chloroflexi bacterium]|nr:DUF58 domain-containing protein [Chloroflexota bacterium]